MKAGVIVLLILVTLTGFALSGCGGIPAVNKGWPGVTIADGTLFLGDMDTRLIAVDTEKATAAPTAKDGKKPVKDATKWAVKLESVKPPSGFLAFLFPVVTEAIYGTPAFEGDLVFTGTYIRIGSREAGRVYAFTASTGLPRWEFPTVETIDGAIVGGLTASQGKVYFGTTAGTVYALDSASGAQKWVFKAGNQVWSTPVIFGGTVYFGSFDKKLYALDAVSGNEKWRFEADGPIVASPLLYNGTLYFGTYDHHIYAVDAATGSKKWESETAKGFWATPIALGNTLYAPCLDNKVYILNTETGQKVSDPVVTDKFVSSSPIIINDAVFIVASGGRIYAIDTVSNQSNAIKDLKEKNVHAPLSSGTGVFYVHSYFPDSLNALTPSADLRQANILWSLDLSIK